MNENEVKKALVSYGLTPRQSLVYLSLIKQLEANVTDIVKDTGIARTTVYLDLVNLEKEGLVGKSKKNGVTYFTPESYNKLITRLRYKEEVISEAMPFIKELSASAKQGSTIRLVQGKDGIIAIWEDILEAYRSGLRESFGFTHIEALIKFMPRYFPKFLEEEAKLPVNVKLVLQRGQKENQTLSTNPRMQLKFISENYAYPGEMTIYGNKIAFFYVDEKNPHAFVIESNEVAEIQKKIFNLLWESLK
jgi:sugar-specific transcriptional regulator TrmB